jgi:hypothetical protein
MSYFSQVGIKDGANLDAFSRLGAASACYASLAWREVR